MCARGQRRTAGPWTPLRTTNPLIQRTNVDAASVPFADRADASGTRIALIGRELQLHRSARGPPHQTYITQLRTPPLDPQARTCAEPHDVSTHWTGTHPRPAGTRKMGLNG